MTGSVTSTGIESSIDFTLSDTGFGVSDGFDVDLITVGMLGNCETRLALLGTAILTLIV
jgi:hypothetical protein